MLCFLIDETLANFIKTKHLAKGEKKTKKEDPSPSQKDKNPKGVTTSQRNKLCSKATLIGKNILEKERERNLKVQ
jgi:hypothetical protein